MGGQDKIPLKAFWEAVEQRLAALSAKELRAILRLMARETLPSERQAFMDRLNPRGEAEFVASQVVKQEDLLDDIEDLAAELEAAMQDAEPWEEYDEWDEYDEEDSLGPYEEFVEPLVELFDRAEAAFDWGNLSLARDAYQGLFEVLGKEDDYGRGLSLHNLTGVDAEEAIARYLRAVYETEPPARRPQVLLQQMQHIGWLTARRPMLNDLVQISPRPLPDQESFLADWIALLRAQSTPDDASADAWLREAVWLAQGRAGLEALARAEGQRRPLVYLDWLTALEQEGEHRQALTVAQEALQALPAGLSIRAAIADHLCAAAARLNETQALREGRWEAFVAMPVLSRLLDLWDCSGDEAERTELMQRAAAHVRDRIARPPTSQEGALQYHAGLEQPVQGDRAVLAHACLLAGDWDAAHRLAAQGRVLGWSSSHNYQGLVVAAFLVLLSGQTPVATSNLAQLWEWSVRHTVSVWSSREQSSLEQRVLRVYAGRFASVSWSAAQQERYLSWCLSVAQERVNAIVGNLHRGSYDKAAVLTAACAEVLRLRGEPEAARRLISDVRGRFPRHRAFQAEMEGAVRRMESGQWLVVSG